MDSEKAAKGARPDQAETRRQTAEWPRGRRELHGMAGHSAGAGFRPGRITIHHVRRFGEPKNDRRTVPLPSSLHSIQENARTSVEALGREGFQAYHQVDFEAAIVSYNEQYQAL